MKKFLIHFFIWSLIALLIAILLDNMITLGLRKTDIRKFATWNEIYKGGLKSDLVIMGSSQAWCSYNTFILDSLLNMNTYNLGIDGHGIKFQIIRYDEYRRFNSKPKIILFNLCFLGSLGISADDQYEREQFFPYIRDEILMSKVAKTKKITWFDRHVPLIRYFGYREDFENGIVSFFGEKEFFDGGMHKGYRGNNYLWDSGILSKDTLISFSYNEESVKQLDMFVRYSIEEGIKIIFVKYPFYAPIRYKFNCINQSDSIFEAISEKYNIPIIDYYYTSISMDSTNYYNPTHLNKKGSNIFTRNLCRDLKTFMDE
jgi:hypothetical protein